MNTFRRFVVAVMLCLVPFGPFARAEAELGVKAPPTKETVLELADKHLKESEAKLSFEAKQGIEAMRTELRMHSGQEIFYKRAIDGMVNQLTLKLAALKNLDALTVASAFLVQEAPKSPRTANLFASVLHTADKIEDAVVVLEYVLSLKPDSQLAKLNLANALIDAGRWEEARTLAEAVVAEDADCMPAHKVLSLYWYEKKNLGNFYDELLKSSRFKGFVRGKLAGKSKRIAKQEGQAGEDPRTLETKARALEEEVPATTADIIEDDFPDAAEQIRQKYGRLPENERMYLPKLPMCNTSSPEGFRRNEPIIRAWANVFKQRAKGLADRELARYGIDTKASKAKMRAQAKAAARKEIATQLQQAQAMMSSLQQMENMSGTQRAKMNQTQKRLDDFAKKQGVELDKTPPEAGKIPGADNGGPLARINYIDYQRIVRTYEFWFAGYFQEFDGKVGDILRVYKDKIEEENSRHAVVMKMLIEEHSKPDQPHGDLDTPCKTEHINHKKQLNAVGQDYYSQWATIYFGQYVSKMKPMIDGYWNVGLLYVRNMHDPEVLKREYSRVIRNYSVQMARAGSMIGVGDAFKYYGPTYEEELALEQEIAEAKEEAQQKEQAFQREFKEPEFDLSKWLEDHLVIEVSGEFLSLKVTAKSIEFEAWAFGPGAGAKYDWIDDKLETSTGVGPKLNIGVNLAGMEAKVEAEGQFIRQTATWDFAKGTYEESCGAKGQVKGGLGPVSASVELEVNTQLEAKATGKIAVEFMDHIEGGVEGEAEWK